MIELRAYPDLPSAWSAAAYLRGNGVLARGIEKGGNPALDALGYRTQRTGVVVIAFEIDRPAAIELLDEHAVTPEPDESAWSAQATPDLSRLPRSMTVPCTGCGADLRNLPGVRLEAGRPLACARCGAANDPIDAVVARHGPEALLGCYPEPSDPAWIDDATLALLRIPCPTCRYPLAGLVACGACPECGRAYDKRAIVERSFMGMPG